MQKGRDVLGKCKLCLRENVSLRKSHGLSAGIYRSLRGIEAEGNQNPYVITSASAKQTSSQKTARILCTDCEQRFSTNGERWVLTNGLKADGAFILKAALDSRRPDVWNPTQQSKVFFTSNFPEVNIPALSYFAASLFWRFSVHPWKTDGGYSVKLGPFEEDFRRYLLGEQPFPEHAALWVVVREGGAISHLTHTPITSRFEDMHVHRFPMPGFAFMLYAGRNLSEQYRNYCIVRGLGNPLFQTSLIEPHLLQEGVRMASRANRDQHRPTR